ncbi:unnamed protein product [Urochloa humidicola]
MIQKSIAEKDQIKSSTHGFKKIVELLQLGPALMADFPSESEVANSPFACVFPSPLLLVGQVLYGLQGFILPSGRRRKSGGGGRAELRQRRGFVEHERWHAAGIRRRARAVACGGARRGGEATAKRTYIFLFDCVRTVLLVWTFVLTTEFGGHYGDGSIPSNHASSRFAHCRVQQARSGLHRQQLPRDDMDERVSISLLPSKCKHADLSALSLHLIQGKQYVVVFVKVSGKKKLDSLATTV